MRIRYLLFSTGLLVLTGPIAHAQPKPPEGISGSVSVGVVRVPEFDGASEGRVFPFIGGRINFDRRYIETRGLGLRANVLNSDGWEAGPAVGFSFGRDDEEDNETIAALDEIDTAVEIGGFVSYSLPVPFDRKGRATFSVEVLQDVLDGHGGWRGRISAGYGRRMTQRLVLTGSVNASVVSDSYNDSFFSVTPAGSEASGLDVFEADGGIKDVGFGAGAIYSLSRKWSLNGFVNYARLIGDAADSPIVTEEGTPDQIVAVFGASRRF